MCSGLGPAGSECWAPAGIQESRHRRGSCSCDQVHPGEPDKSPVASSVINRRFVENEVRMWLLYEGRSHARGDSSIMN